MVQVTVSEGVLDGEVIRNELAEFISFKGIPYAAPPAPQPAASWNGVRSAKDFGHACYQHDLMMAHQSPYGEEDCLYLNVYTPDIKPATLIPVMFYIHGGAFICGSGNDDFYGPEFLVKKGIILVTINYRVGALGYLSLGTEDIPGNAGMKDQVAALKWVKKNIKNFGGDPDNITIFGESAGAASVSYHLVSPMSKGLFKRAIAMSGCLTNTWAQSFEARERALKLAKQLGFNSEDDKELYQFLKNLPKEKLVNLKLPVTKSVSPNDLEFGIVSEKKFGANERFFYGNECDVLRNGIHEGVEVMTGYTKDEGLMAFASGLTLEQLLSEANAFKEFFAPTPIQRDCNIKVQLEVGRKLQKYYVDKNLATAEDFVRLLQYFNLNMFVHGIVLFGKFLSKKTKVYFYKVTCQSERNIISKLFNLDRLLEGRQVVCHADDLMYLFPVKMAQLKVEKGSEAEKLIIQITTLWTNFAKF
ncbi:Antennal esterase CXE10, partial [Operophtera brumata]